MPLKKFSVFCRNRTGAAAHCLPHSLRMDPWFRAIAWDWTAFLFASENELSQFSQPPIPISRRLLTERCALLNR